MVVIKAVGTVFFSVCGLIATGIGIYRLFRPLSEFAKLNPAYGIFSLAAMLIALAVVLFFETKKEYQFYKISR